MLKLILLGLCFSQALGQYATSTVAETTMGETTMAETTMAETTVAETTMPETTIAETTMPETTMPETTTTMMETTPRITTCEDFQDGVCPLYASEVVSMDEETESPSACQDKCITSALLGEGCKWFTHFETTCYLLRTCDSVAPVPGCVSGPYLPDYDSCVETTAAPETTTAAETTIVTTAAETTAAETTTVMETTTDNAECSGFYPGFLCTAELNLIDTITHIMTPTECQTLCQLRGGCTYWSHWVEVKDEHIGHCDLHWSCPYLEEDKCLSEADPKCPIIPSSIYGDVGDMNDAAEEVDAPQDKKSMPPGPGSGECGCISGPAYPSIDECDFW